MDFHLCQCSFLQTQMGLFQVHCPVSEIKHAASDFRIKKTLDVKVL